MLGKPRPVAEEWQGRGARPEHIADDYSITLGSTDLYDFSESRTAEQAARRAGIGTITVRFKPTATSARTATLNIQDSVGTQIVQFSGTAK